MAKQIRVPVHTKGGHLFLDNRRAFDASVATWTDGPGILTLERPRRKRSDPQNRWLHGVCIKLIAEHCGYDRDEREQLRHDLMGLCFGFEEGALGVQRPKIRSSKLTVEQFSTFMEWVVRWAAKEPLCIRIPLPDDPICESIMAEDEAA